MCVCVYVCAWNLQPVCWTAKYWRSWFARTAKSAEFDWRLTHRDTLTHHEIIKSSQKTLAMGDEWHRKRNLTTMSEKRYRNNLCRNNLNTVLSKAIFLKLGLTQHRLRRISILNWSLLTYFRVCPDFGPFAVSLTGTWPQSRTQEINWRSTIWLSICRTIRLISGKSEILVGCLSNFMVWFHTRLLSKVPLQGEVSYFLYQWRRSILHIVDKTAVLTESVLWIKFEQIIVSVSFHPDLGP